MPVLASGDVAPNVKALFRPNTFGECKMWLTVIQRGRFEANLRYLARIRPHNVQPIIDSAYAPPLTNAKHNLTEKLNEFYAKQRWDSVPPMGPLTNGSE